MMKKSLEIHSENILPIIKKWLYSDKDIFVRELVSNACDAIYKVKLLRDQGLISQPEENYRIDIQINKNERTLKFTDTGIGMDAEEVQKYIAQIAFSGAEDFVAKYQTNNEKDQFIGHFGLGFYSAYMVAEKVQIDTLSYKEGAEPVLWTCDGSSEYTIDKGQRQKRGTEITLFIDKDNDEYLDEKKMRQILEHYCAFLPYPIYLGDLHINKQEPLWIKNPSTCTTQEYLDFYRHLFPLEMEPLFWVHLNVDYPFHLKGILYFPKLRRDADLSKSTVNLYCNRVFVSDSCKDVIPNYLMNLRGVIDSPDIPLNVSRSYLQMDRTVRQLGGHISKKVADSLATLYRTEREKFIQSWPDISVIVKLGILEDEKFYDKTKEFLIWKNTDGVWTTVEEYLERNKEKTNHKIFYTKDEKHSMHVLDIYKKRGIEVLCADSPFDPFLMQFIERKMPETSFQRVDAAIDESLLDKAREKTILDASGRTEAAILADFIRSKLHDDQVVVEAKSLAADALPGFILIDENQRRLRDYMLHLDPKDFESKMNLIEKKTFVVNTNSPVMASIQKIDAKDPELAADLVKQTYELALLSQREMDPSQLNEFIARSTRVLEKISSFLVHE
jgi:molecular chaperone HtpG